MIIGVPREFKIDEYRVGMTPSGVHGLVENGHTVLVEYEAGTGSGIDDRQYEDQGARISARDEIFAQSDMIVKVKEPLPE